MPRSLSRFNARILYRLARLLYRSSLAHSGEMKQAKENPEALASYRSKELVKVLEAAKRYGVSFEQQIVIDLGCNDGSLSSRYLDVGAKEVIGLDIDAEAIERANRLYRVPGLRFVQTTETRIPLDDNSADVIVSYDVFEHIADPPSVIAECYRVLKPGGKMLIGTWGWYHPFAPHLWAVMPVPWAHVFVSERTLLMACRLVYESSWYVPNMHDVDKDGRRKEDKYLAESIPTGYLNKYFVSDFEKAFRQSQFDARVHLVPFGSRLAAWTKILLPVPGIREFVTGYLWITCVKPMPAQR